MLPRPAKKARGKSVIQWQAELRSAFMEAATPEATKEVVGSLINQARMGPIDQI